MNGELPHRDNGDLHNGTEGLDTRPDRDFFVSIIRDSNPPRHGLLLGPFPTHQAALDHVRAGADEAMRADAFAAFDRFGTCSLPAPSERTGVLNHILRSGAPILNGELPSGTEIGEHAAPALSPAAIDAWIKRLGINKITAAALLNTPYQTFVAWTIGNRAPPQMLAETMRLIEAERAKQGTTKS